jgi:hypothetical protein
VSISLKPFVILVMKNGFCMRNRPSVKSLQGLGEGTMRQGLQRKSFRNAKDWSGKRGRL